jgi:hypothetical protein
MLRWRGRATHVSARSLILSTLMTGLDGRSNFEQNGGALAPSSTFPSPALKGEVFNSLFVCEGGTPVERLYLVTFKDHETHVRILHVTRNDRLGATAIYLNLIDMHVVDEYTQK